MNPIIPHQGSCGSCWTFAATGTIEAHLAIATGEKEPTSLSEQYLLNCVPDPEHCGGEGVCVEFVACVALHVAFFFALCCTSFHVVESLGVLFALFE